MLSRALFKNSVTSWFSEDCPRSVRHFPEIPDSDITAIPEKKLNVVQT